MKKQWLRVIERAIHGDQELFPLNQTWEAVHHEYNIGLPWGNKLKLSRQDKAELLRLVKSKMSLDLSRQSMADLDDLHREEVLSIGVIDEKLAGQAVKKDRLAMRALPGSTLKINRRHYTLPDSGYLDIASDAVISIEHYCVLVVENYRNIDALAKMPLNLEAPFHDPLVIFRGDKIYSENTVRQLIMRLAISALAMPDMDPKGLVIAQSLPHVVGLVAPRLPDLERMLKDPSNANPELYAKQLAYCQKALTESPYPVIVEIWEKLQQYQAGIAQEHWLNGEVDLSIYMI